VKLYLAGPMRGHTYYNFPLFLWAACTLRLRGHEVVSPAELDLEVKSVEWDMARCELVWDHSQQKTLQRAVSAALACDGMALLPGWEKSEGVRTEIGATMQYASWSYRYFELDEHLTMHEITPAEAAERLKPI